MKQCPVCNQTYSDEDLNFCLNDGELLRQTAAEPRPRSFLEDSPPTLMMHEVRSTNPTGWQPPSAPPVVWTGNQQNVPQAQFAGPYATPLAMPNQTLAIVSLCLGIASVTVGWCCSLGLLLAPAALITGFIAQSQIKNDPQKYTGKGLAIGGMVAG